MTSREKREVLEQVWGRLKAQFDSLANGCRATFIGPHLEHPERTVTILTTVPVRIGGEESWITCWQEGGGFKVILWVPPVAGVRINPEAKQLAEQVAAELRGSVSRLGLVQVRYIKPHKFLAERGWPLKNGCN